MIEATATNLGARLACFPRHRDEDAIPVVGLIEGVPLILGNARTATGAMMMGYVFGIQAKAATLQCIDTGAIFRQFYFLREAM